MKNITILGSTGSIGENTLDVIKQHPDLYNIFALTANTNVEKMANQCVMFKPKFAVMKDKIAAKQLQRLLVEHNVVTQVLTGENALKSVASDSEADYVVAAIVGATGLLPTLAAVKAGKRVLLANKEALVMSGGLFMAAARESGADILPVDSEHNAIFQCMPPGYRCGEKPRGVQKIIITASGGPFRDLPIETLSTVTPEQACNHPNWKMGKKVSIDSATMMNKCLEVIEAYWLFNLQIDQIETILHPQSVIHSFVEYVDGSMLAQLGNPDMRTPIACSLSWPKRINSNVNSLNLKQIAKLEFAELSTERFSGILLAYQALKAGGTASTILNAANEIAVAAFLQQQIAFTDIVIINKEVMNRAEIKAASNIDVIIEADRKAREIAKNTLKETVLL